MPALAAFTTLGADGQPALVQAGHRTPPVGTRPASSPWACSPGQVSSCCAPVLAGVMTLSALAGSPLGGMVLGLAYVFGDGVPAVRDGAGLGPVPPRKFLKARPVRIHLGAHIPATNTVNLVVAGFTVMGLFVMYLAGSGQMTSGRGSRWLSANAWPRPSAGWRKPPGSPEVFLGLVVLALAACVVRLRHPCGTANAAGHHLQLMTTSSPGTDPSTMKTPPTLLRPTSKDPEMTTGTTGRGTAQATHEHINALRAAQGTKGPARGSCGYGSPRSAPPSR